MSQNRNDLKAELSPAFVWDCSECGRENFERTVVAELSTEEMDELRYEHGVAFNEGGHFMTSPSVVECKHCGAVMDAVAFDQQDSDCEDRSI